MDRDPFGHRKYHGLYFILGFLIAFVAFMMLSGCEQPNATSGVEPEGNAAWHSRPSVWHSVKAYL